MLQLPWQQSINITFPPGVKFQDSFATLNASIEIITSPRREPDSRARTFVDRQIDPTDYFPATVNGLVTIHLTIGLPQAKKEACATGVIFFIPPPSGIFVAGPFSAMDSGDATRLRADTLMLSYSFLHFFYFRSTIIDPLIRRLSIYSGNTIEVGNSEIFSMSCSGFEVVLEISCI